MKNEMKYMNQSHLSGEAEKMIAGSGIKWEKSKEQVWMEMEGRVGTRGSVEMVPLHRYRFNLAVAAGLALLVGVAALLGYHRKTIIVPAGMHSEVYLPDKSVVKLNAQSELSYRPFSWRISRTVWFEGEAFFDVKKGKRFGVVSGKGTTNVLGTTFNIYTRYDEYQVTCISGRVKVTGKTAANGVTLVPGQKAFLGTEGLLSVQTVTDTEQTLKWLDNKLSFTSVPLRRVFEEIGRQYGISIIMPANLEKTYTGTFAMEPSVKNVLNLVCKPFDLKYVQESDNRYIITAN